MNINEEKTVTTTIDHCVKVYDTDIVRLLRENGFDCPYYGVTLQFRGSHSDDYDITTDNPIIVQWKTVETVDCTNP